MFGKKSKPEVRVKFAEPVKLRIYQCQLLECKQIFRSETDRDDHERNNYHCQECGFGFGPTTSTATRPQVCTYCNYIDGGAFPKDRSKIV
jgi:DNA-directed RNA polymerase subunit RPC12/RpoP